MTEYEHIFKTGHRGLNKAQFRTGARAPRVNDALLSWLSLAQVLNQRLLHTAALYWMHPIHTNHGQPSGVITVPLQHAKKT